MKYSFNSLDTAAIAAVAASTNARMEGTEGQERRETNLEFATRRGAELDAEAQAIKDKGGVPNDEHVDEHEKAEAEEEVSAPAKRPADAIDEGDGDDDEVVEEEEEEVEGEKDGDDDEDEDDRPGDEFARAAGKHEIPVSLEDLPEEARPLVKARLKAIEKGFTRAMMDVRSYRAEERYRTEHPVEFLADMLAEDPDLETKVSEELAKRGDETYAESRKIISERDRENARKETAREQREADTRANRGSTVEQLTQAACTKYGIPFGEAVEAAIANIVLTSDDRDIDDAEIPKVVKRIAAQFGIKARADNREERAEVVRAKVKDKAAAPKVRPGSGRPAQPRVPEGTKLTLEQNMARSVAEMFPGAD